MRACLVVMERKGRGEPPKRETEGVKASARARQEMRREREWERERTSVRERELVIIS